MRISRYALDVSAIHIADTVPESPGKASLTVKGLTAGDERLPMRLGPNCWRLSLGKSPVAVLRSELTGTKGR